MEVEVLLILSALEVLEQGIVEGIDIDSEDAVLVREEGQRGLQPDAGRASRDDDDFVVARWVDHGADGGRGAVVGMVKLGERRRTREEEEEWRM